ncbi:hypothetical protein A2U01_0097460, partial [Trifolium medium]|nr:hypothetical protein [Trifolium medium]
MMASDMRGIGLEVVLPCSNEEVEKVPGSSSFCTSGREFRQGQSGVRDMCDGDVAEGTSRMGSAFALRDEEEARRIMG